MVGLVGLHYTTEQRRASPYYSAAERWVEAVWQPISTAHRLLPK